MGVARTGVKMLTGKLFAALTGLLLVFAVLAKLKLHPSPPVPIYLQIVVGLSCVIFASTFLLAGRWVRPSLDQTLGLLQFGFVAFSVCVLIFEFDVYPLLSNKPDPLGYYLIPVAALTFLIACALFVANATWTVIRVFRLHTRVRPD